MAALRLAAQPGAWQRAGLTGVATGIDMAGALSRIDATGLDVGLVQILAVSAEAGMLEGFALATPANKDGRDQ